MDIPALKKSFWTFIPSRFLEISTRTRFNWCVAERLVGNQVVGYETVQASMEMANFCSGRPEDTNLIIQVLSEVLTRLIDVNLKSNARQQFSTKFQSSYAPGISIYGYLERISKYAKCSANCFIVALIYIDRLIETRSIVLSSLNVHRILITSILLSTKVFEDEFYKNAYYAKLGGISTQEINSLELEFLSMVNFNMCVSTDTFKMYQQELQCFLSKPVPQPIPVGATFYSSPQQLSVDVNSPTMSVSSPQPVVPSQNTSSETLRKPSPVEPGSCFVALHVQQPSQGLYSASTPAFMSPYVDDHNMQISYASPHQYSGFPYQHQGHILGGGIPVSMAEENLTPQWRMLAGPYASSQPHASCYFPPHCGYFTPTPFVYEPRVQHIWLQQEKSSEYYPVNFGTSNCQVLAHHAAGVYSIAA